jgi:hypothetical protein
MKETLLMGRGKDMVEIPRAEWEEDLSRVPGHCKHRLAFMSEAHHTVRNYVVKELPSFGKPIPPERIGQALNLTHERVREIVYELERNLFFLVRDQEGAVAWAFPVTAEKTTHQLIFSTGERIHAA